MKNLKSGEFLVKSTDSSSVFIPEEYNEEQLMIAQTIKDFIETEVNPIVEKLDQGDRELMAETVRKAGELGLMGIAIPEEYGGFEQDFVTQMLAAENIGAGYSFSVAFMASTGIGTLPIMYYGNEEQRQKYVTKLASGEFIGAYCLTEPNAGSDANSGKAQAILSEDETHYILNGQKMWITNAGFADTHVVFAKIANDRVLSAFIVEKNMPGVVIGPDEHKMGIKGSSTCQIYYNDVKVPAENLIGRGGMGFRIALNILHMGRIKLGANVIGAAKKSTSDAIKYANERKQFNVLISSFATIKHKIAEQAIKTFALESSIYRASNDIDVLMKELKAGGMDKGLAAIEAIAHYAVEAALLKVYGSEVLDFVVDETVQIHGGMGYSAEMNADRGYRDSRINRIFEGTNEINRLLLVETAIKRGMKGDFDMAGIAQEFYNNMESCRIDKKEGENFFEQKLRYIENFKRAALILIHKVTDKYGKDMLKEQEVINNISDMMIQIYTAESLALRVKKIADTNAKTNIDLYKDMLDVYVYEAAAIVSKNAIDAVYSMTEGEESEKIYKALKNLTCVQGVNTKDARRRIAEFLIEENEYKF
ncbi:MAG: acyl-CoA dehydrogenase [Bacteroidales bacterium]|jgi:alkylation response protein AidB-like acyl-CoA dehydrogenase|nr:acyl-CoA dehydrogenase family protein [Bacteroidales bacterium]MDY0314293.1 acyl-CoA dehydrogenase family protein [Bacteroidales bacterium]NLB85440.1 acyl-CoA dehydrogenase [Bacteroidales bacterium]